VVIISIKVSLKPRSEILDDMVTEIKLNSKYVSDGIGDNYNQWNSYNPVFISAQTGTGKNTFIEDVLIKVACKLNRKILIVSNRIANSRQQKERIATLVGCSQELEMYTPKGLDAIEDFNNVKVITYHKLEYYVSNLLKCRELDHYLFVVYDEVHFFVSDSLFNNKTGRILKNSLLAFKSSIRIYMTATPDEILPIVIEKEKLLQSNTFEALYSINYPIRPKELFYYNFKRKYDYINTKYFSNKGDLLEKIKNDRSSDKWLIFVSSKDSGKYFLEQLGNNSVFITSESKNSQLPDGNVYNEIVKDEKFSCKVLISTSALDNGINFKDSSLKNIVIFTHDKTEFIQMLGRKRVLTNEKVNLYICARDNTYFYKKLHTINSKIQAICCYKNNKLLFMNNYIFNDDINKYSNVRQLFYSDEKLEIQLNELAEKKLYLDKRFIEKMLGSLNSGVKEAFIKEQLSWIGLQKTYRLESWVSYINADKNKATFLKFLEDNCDTDLSPEEFDTFGEKFKELSISAFGKQPGDRPDRNYKETKMRIVFNKYNLNYDIKVKNKIYTLVGKYN